MNKPYDLEERTEQFAGMVIGLCRKEAKESRYWLRLIMPANLEFEPDINKLIQEATELMNIFGAILKKST